MRRSHWEDNLGRLINDLTEYVGREGIACPDPMPLATQRFAEGVFLAHAAPESKFVQICKTNRLLSQDGLVASGILNADPNTDEAVLGTTDDVFFYAATFRIPARGCGLLFARSLEEKHSDDGVATPFDSGALLHVCTRANKAEAPKDFLLRHETPVTEHRNYLCQSLNSLFSDPLDYLNGTDPHHPGPIGLTGGDCRRWTHEVRIPKEVILRSADLKAVLIPRRLGAVPEIQSLVGWCDAEGFDTVIFGSDGSNDFANLQRACIEYIRSKLF